MEIDNRLVLLGDQLKEHLGRGSKVKMAAATFSMFAYQSLKEELEQIEELKFIFTSPTFTTNEVAKEYREYTIPKKRRESSIFGAEYELKLMNELTQKSLARECADWVRRKAKFKSINVNEEIDNGIRIENKQVFAVDKLKNFDRKELGYENSLFKSSRNLYTEPQSLTYLRNFEDYWENDEYFRDVTEEVLENLTLAHKEHSPEFLYYVMLYNIFSEFLEDVNQDQLPNEHVQYKETKIWNLLYDFQKDAVKSLISKLERYNGCILADSVGLGKTFTALAVMTYYAYRGKCILVLCPKKLEHNWNMYRHDYVNNPIYDRYLQYDVLYHTDLSRDKGTSNGIDLALNRWDTYDLVVIDESHNFRNGGSSDAEIEEGRENRYSRLMNRIIKSGVPTKVLMLSATPVNNRFNDLKNQIALAYEGDAAQFDAKLDTKSSINDIFRMAQTAYNQWAVLPAESRTTAALLDKLDFDFFKVLDSVTIARSRKHIRQFYDRNAIGDFPERLAPKNFYPDLTVSRTDITYERIYALLDQLQLTIYQPSLFIHPSKRFHYEKEEGQGLTQLGRETGIKKLMMINLLKRLESSVEAFRYTLIDVVKAYVDKTIQSIEQFEVAGGEGKVQLQELAEDDFDVEDSNTDFFVGKKFPIKLADMDYLSWKRDLQADQTVLRELEELVNHITPKEDQKLQTLFNLIDEKLTTPINPDNKKLIIFSAFATTTDYLYKNISQYLLDKYGLHTAQISGTKGFSTTLSLKNKDLNTILTYFSPKSKQKDLLYPDDPREIDVLIATDVISEGQNLQDADTMINYDIHWNPVRIVQRFGRVDRIGSQNKYIQLVNFWPNIALDTYIDLKARVESRMKISVLTSTADDNVLTNEEIEDNNYRKKQLERLQTEVVDLEDMNEGISIMDLGLEDYRMDLLSYLAKHPELEDMPKGLQAVVQAGQGQPEGAIFLLKNISTQTNLSKKNRLHPYYLVYISDEGETVYSIADTKALLEHLRMITKGKNQPENNLVATYNHATDDGAKMGHYSDLLQKSLENLVESDEETFSESLFSFDTIDFMDSGVEGNDDFELLAFFAVLNPSDEEVNLVDKAPSQTVIKNPIFLDQSANLREAQHGSIHISRYVGTNPQVKQLNNLYHITFVENMQRKPDLNSSLQEVDVIDFRSEEYDQVLVCFNLLFKDYRLQFLDSHQDGSLQDKDWYLIGQDKLYQLLNQLLQDVSNKDLREKHISYSPAKWQIKLANLTQRKINILNVAPEIATLDENIEKKAALLSDYIQSSPAKLELEVLHDESIRRYEDILSGYLKLSQDSDLYIQSEERKEQALSIMLLFESNLTKSLKRYHEQDLQDFKVSLRLLQADGLREV